MRWPRQSGWASVDCEELTEASDKFHRYRLCVIFVVLHLDPRAPRTPRLPHQRLGALRLAASIALHVSLVVVAALIETTSAPGVESRRVGPTTDQQVQHLVFLSPEWPRMGGGGGGGGNQQPGPIRRAQGVGAETITLRVRKRRRRQPR